MRRLILLLTLLVTYAVADDRPIVFRGITVVDGTGARPQRQLDVLLGGDRIVKVGPRVRAPEKAR
ncbi:MAG TPA: hypothetical protein VFL57_06290, partial [Bryobacteraceae bacterium]|nr:hypothetical protein [Bryobacteraceae bacterium]